MQVFGPGDEPGDIASSPAGKDISAEPRRALPTFGILRTLPSRPSISAHLWHFFFLPMLLPLFFAVVVPPCRGAPAPETVTNDPSPTNTFLPLNPTLSVSLPPPPGSYIATIFVDSNGTVWIGTWTGLFAYDPPKQQWSAFTSADWLPSDRVLAITSDPDGALWVGTDEGLVRRDPETRRWETLTTADGLPSNRVRALAATPDGAFWIGTTEGLVRQDPDTGKWETFAMEDGLPSKLILSLAIAPDSTLWVGTSHGLARWDEANGRWRTFTKKHRLLSEAISALAAAADGTLWIGTPRGLARWHVATDQWEEFPFQHIVPPNDIEAVVTSTDGALWVGTHTGLAQRNPGDSQWKTFSTRDGLPSRYITALAIAPDGALWVGTRSGLVRRDASSDQWDPIVAAGGLPSNSINALAATPDGSLWAGTRSGLAQRDTETGRWKTLAMDNGLPSNQVLSLAVTPDGTLWIGTNAGLVRRDPHTGSLEVSTTKGVLPWPWIRALAVTPDGDIWAGTTGGLARRDVKTNQWKAIKRPGGRGSDSIDALATEPDGTLWVNSFSGLARRDVDTGRWRIFEREGAPPSWLATFRQPKDPFNGITALCVGPDRALWAGTSSGDLARRDPVTGRWEVIDISRRWRAIEAITWASDRSLLYASIGRIARWSPGPHRVIPVWQGGSLRRPGPPYMSSFGSRDRQLIHWFVWPGGLSRIEDGRTATFGIEPAGGFPTVLEAAPDGGAFVGFALSGVTRYDPDGTPHHLPLDQLPDPAVHDLAPVAGPAGKVACWVATDDGACLVERRDNQWVVTRSIEAGRVVPSGTVDVVARRPGGGAVLVFNPVSPSFFVTGQEEAAKRRRATRIVEVDRGGRLIASFDIDRDTWPALEVLDVAVDRSVPPWQRRLVPGDEVLWLATNRGLFRASPHAYGWEHHRVVVEGWANEDPVRRVIVHPEDAAVWMGIDTAAIAPHVVRYLPWTGEVTTWSHAEGVPEGEHVDALAFVGSHLYVSVEGRRAKLLAPVGSLPTWLVACNALLVLGLVGWAGWNFHRSWDRWLSYRPMRQVAARLFEDAGYRVRTKGYGELHVERPPGRSVTGTRAAPSFAIALCLRDIPDSQDQDRFLEHLLRRAARNLEGSSPIPCILIYENPLMRTSRTTLPRFSTGGRPDSGANVSVQVLPKTARIFRRKPVPLRLVPILLDDVQNALRRKQAHAFVEKILRPDARPNRRYEKFGPLADPEDFHGREKILEQLVADLRSNRNVLLAAIPKMGVTSLLYRVCERLKDSEGRPVIWLEDLAGIADPEAVVERLTREETARMDRRHVRGRRSGDAVPPVVVIDGIDLAPSTGARRDAPRTPPPDPETVLRKLFDAAKPVNDGPPRFVVLVSGQKASIDRVRELARDAGVPGDGICERVLGPMTKQETKDMLRHLVGPHWVTLDEATAAAIHEDAGGHPFLARRLASLVSRSIARKDSRTREIKVQTYRAWRGSWLARDDVWRDFTDVLLSPLASGERKVLGLLARHGDVPIAEIHDLLDRPREARPLLESLEARGYLVRDHPKSGRTSLQPALLREILAGPIRGARSGPGHPPPPSPGNPD